MYLSDFHVHTDLSPDSSTDILDICDAAIERGMNVICITDHWECGEICLGWQLRRKPFDQERCISQFEKAKEYCEGRVELLFGVEIGNWHEDLVHGEIALNMYPVDFVLGSLHTIGGEDSYFVDYKRPDANSLLHQYIVESGQMASQVPIDALGHLTLPQRYAYTKEGITLSYKDSWAAIDDVLKIIIDNGIALEANTCGGRIQDPVLPGVDVFSRYKELGGELVTIGSDGHNVDHVAVGVREVQRLLRELGFVYHFTYKERKPVAHRL